MHVNFPLREAIKIPSIKECFDTFFLGSNEPMDPPIMLQADHFRVQYGENPPFFMTLMIKQQKPQQLHVRYRGRCQHDVT